MEKLKEKTKGGRRVKRMKRKTSQRIEGEEKEEGVLLEEEFDR